MALFTRTRTRKGKEKSMTDKEIKDLIEATARRVVHETKRQMIISDIDKMAEKDISDMLRSHFHSKRNKKLDRALSDISYDPYYQIINLYYKENEKIENIAELMQCDISTVSRNKKRLCRMLYRKII